MDFAYTDKVMALQAKLTRFMDEHVYPNERRWHEEIEENTRAGRRWTPLEVIAKLKSRAREQGLWNLWWPKPHGGELTNLEYAPLCEIMGRVHWAPEVFNCSAPDTGNMEKLIRYGTPGHIRQWCAPLCESMGRVHWAPEVFNCSAPDTGNMETLLKSGTPGHIRQWCEPLLE